MDDEPKSKLYGARFEFKVSFALPDDESLESDTRIDTLRIWLEQLIGTEGMTNVEAKPIKAEYNYDQWN